MYRSYIYGDSSISWADYLKIDAIEKVENETSKIRTAITSSSKKLIVSNQEIAAGLNAGFERISSNINEVSRGISELTASFEWGISELLVEVGKVNDSLNKLIKIAKTPAQTWAYEQFEIARDAYRKKLYSESVEYIDRAINGSGDNIGYKLEYRFHMLKGTIYLGSYKNNSSKIIDLSKAMSAFLTAARYAEHDHKEEAGRAFLAAGWCAYCQGLFVESIKFTKNAISLHPQLGEAYYQMSKLLMHNNKPDQAIKYLSKSIYLDRDYIVKAYNDKDFVKHSMQLSLLADRLFDESKHKANNLLEVLHDERDKLLSLRVSNISFKDYINLDNFICSDLNFSQLFKKTNELFKVNSYYGYSDAISVLEKGIDCLYLAKEKFVEDASYKINDSIYDLKNNISRIKEKNFLENGTLIIIVIIGVLISFSGGVKSCSRIDKHNNMVLRKMINEMTPFVRSKRIPGPYSLEDVIRAYPDAPCRIEDIPRVGGLEGFFGWLIMGGLVSLVIPVVFYEFVRNKQISNLNKKLNQFEKVKQELFNI